MSKIPHNSLWARATTASTSSRASSVLTKSHFHYHASSSASQRASTSVSAGSVLVSDAAALIPGAVAAPFFGPQPAGFAEALDQSTGGDNSMIALPGQPTLAAPYQTSFLLSAPILRNVGTGLTTNHASPRPHRPMHMWSHAQMNPETSLNNRLPATTKSAAGTKLLFDANSNSAGGASSSRFVQSDAMDDFISSLLAHLPEAGKNDSLNWLSEAASLQQQSSSYFSNGVSDAGIGLPTKDEVNTPSALPPSRTPSPKQSSYRHNVNRDSIHFGHVREPPAKFATTTSAEWSLSSSASSGSSSTSSSQANLSLPTSSAAASTSSFSSSTPPAPGKPQTVLNDHWAKAFNVPRSTKQNDFMFEHGAYGIPKRHPLSSIRSSRNSDAKDKGKQKQGPDRSAPSPDDVPTTSKVQQAAGMLAAAADFLAGPQTGSSSSSREHRPMKGEEALNMAFSGGSTAEGHEVERYSASGRRLARSEAVTQDLSRQQFSDQQSTSSSSSSSINRVAIRGEDGRIIKDRLRSVQVGEDAYFLRPDSLGVADGVGGWTSRPGADPALFSRLLMHFCAVELSRYDNLSASDLASDNGNRLKAWAAVDPVEVMHRAWERCVRASRREGILGSSTALLALLRGDELRIANVGDCVLMIIRGGEMLFRSTEQQHSFNFPVQLGMMGDTAETMKKRTEAASKARAAGEGEVRSEHMEDYDDVEDLPHKNAATNASSSKSFEETIDGHAKSASDLDDEEGPEWDEPRRDAGRWSIRVQADDIIVVGSDGLMDNLFDEDIIEEVVRFLPVQGQGSGASQSEDSLRSVDASSFSPQLVSEALCSRAKAVSEDSRAISSPFQQRAMEEGLHYVGGKHDDISVLVCLVGEREGAEMSSSGLSGNTPTSNKCLIH